MDTLTNRKEPEFTFLTEQQFFSGELDFLKKRGCKAAVTDFSIILGGCITPDTYIDSDKNNLLENRTCEYWTSTFSREKDDISLAFCSVSIKHFEVDDYTYLRHHGARPACRFSEIFSNSLNMTINKKLDNVTEIEYGYYPQQSAPESLQFELEYLYKKGYLKATYNTFTTDSRKCEECDKDFLAQSLKEYEYEGKRYVRIIVSNSFKNEICLSNGINYKRGDAVWIEVSPVKWLVDEKEDIMLSEKVLFAGVQFVGLYFNGNEVKSRINYKSDFNSTDIKKFMDMYFSKELIQSNIIQNEISNKNEKKAPVKTLGTKPSSNK